MTRGTVCDFFFTKLRPEKYHTMGSRTMRNRPPQVLNRTRMKEKRRARQCRHWRPAQRAAPPARALAYGIPGSPG